MICDQITRVSQVPAATDDYLRDRKDRRENQAYLSVLSVLSVLGVLCGEIQLNFCCSVAYDRFTAETTEIAEKTRQHSSVTRLLCGEILLSN